MYTWIYTQKILNSQHRYIIRKTAIINHSIEPKQIMDSRQKSEETVRVIRSFADWTCPLYVHKWALFHWNLNWTISPSYFFFILNIHDHLQSDNQTTNPIDWLIDWLIIAWECCIQWMAIPGVTCSDGQSDRKPVSSELHKIILAKVQKGYKLLLKKTNNWIQISCGYALLHIMYFITTKFHEILLSVFRGVALTNCFE